MSENRIENPFQSGGFIETTHGYIYKDDIPYVINEPFTHKFYKSILFYSVFIAVIVLIIYITNAEEYRKKAIKALQANQLWNAYPQTKKIPSFVEAQVIKIYNYTNLLAIDHIVLIDVYGNIIDVDTKYNYFVNHIKLGSRAEGDLYSIDFGTPQLIREITLIADPDKMDINLSSDKGTVYTIDLYDADNKKVWNHNGIVNQKENTIPIYNEVYLSDAEVADYKINNNKYEKLYGGNTDQIILFNEYSLALKLQEDGQDSYTAY